MMTIESRFKLFFAKAMFALVTSFAAILVTGCGKKSPENARTAVVEANTTDPVWVKQAQPRSKIAIVFVHGVFGDTLGTWTNSNGKTFFDHVAAAQTVGPNVDLFAFGFTSNMFGSGSLGINEAANKLTESLQFKGVSDYPAVVFVAHSMGGLVVLRNLISNPEFAKKVPLVILFATPQEGAEISTIADKVARNPGLAQMLPADRNGFLQQLSDDWRRLPMRPRVSCGYEKLPTYGVVVVPWTTATRFCDDTPAAIEGADHMTIAKPDRAEHGSVVLLVNAMSRHVMGKNFGARLEMPDFVAEGDHYAVELQSNQRSVRVINPGRSKVRFTVAEVSDKLYVVPDDTPRDIGAEEALHMNLILMAGAQATEYRFKLRSDVPSEDMVVVRVPDIETVRKGRAAFINAIVGALNDHLGDEEKVVALRKFPIGDERALEQTTQVAFDAVAKRSPGMPAGATWLMTADLLSSAELPQLAVTALRQAESASPATIGTRSAQDVAGVVAAQSGQKAIFLKAQTPAPAAVIPKTTQWLNSSIEFDGSIQLARRLKTVNSLRSLGLGLEGDVLRAKGDNGAALKAYGEAAAIDNTPSIATRIKATESLGMKSKAERLDVPGVAERAILRP